MFTEAADSAILSSMKKIISLGKDTFLLYLKRDIRVYAGNATLFIVTAFFPFLMWIIAIVNLLPQFDPEDVTEMLLKFLPDLSSIQYLIRNLVINLKHQSTGLLASLSAVTALWSASAGFTAIQKGLKKISPDAPEPKMTDKASAVVYTLILMVLIPVILIIHALGDIAVTAAEHLSELIGISNITGVVREIIEASNVEIVVFCGVAVLLIYRFVPGGKRRIFHQLPGAIFTSVLWAVFTKAFSFLIPRIYRASSIYGSLASLFLVLMWVRYIIAIMFIGASLNTVLQRQRRLRERLESLEQMKTEEKTE